MSDEYKFGVEDLADKLGIEGASVRIKLRNAKIKKADNGRYGWKTKSELDEVAAKLKETKAAPAKSTKKDDKKAPAKGGDKKSSEKPADKKAPTSKKPANDKAAAKKKAA